MKTLLAAALLCSFSASAQTIATKPFKKANVVVLQTSDSTNAALRTFGQALVARGYTIKKLDNTFHTLTTEPKQVRGGVMPMAVTVRAAQTTGGLAITAESAVDITGLSGGAQPAIQRLVITGEPPKGPLAEVIEAAKAYPGGTVGYRRE